MAMALTLLKVGDEGARSRIRPPRRGEGAAGKKRRVPGAEGIPGSSGRRRTWWSAIPPDERA